MSVRPKVPGIEAPMPWMTAVCADVADAEPRMFVPVTWTGTVVPTSDALRTYVELVALGMLEQALPDGSQLCHWYANVGAPSQEPLLTVRVCPCCAVPEMVGSTVFAGGAGVNV